MGFIQWPVSSKIKALYHLNDVNDSSGNNYTLTNNGTVAFALGKFGNCGVFASGKYLNVASTFGINPLTGAYSISAWVKPTAQPSSGAYFGIFAIEATSARGIHLFYYNNSGTYQITGSYSGNTITGTYTLSSNTWYQIVFTSSAAGAGAIYVNGAKIATASRGTNSTPRNDIFGIGWGWTTAAKYFTGSIDEVVIHNVELSPKQVLLRYAFEKGLL